ncbi:UNVERIFIED_CONTAM: O-fucosyltransferase 39 [Sesamum radiatum]|uniref:O-fucosyltransferase family protein n=1 Tax=Sesamum radiatum TaxID=300843 RepID=A0AAW2RG44_SESRA
MVERATVPFPSWSSREMLGPFAADIKQGIRELVAMSDQFQSEQLIRGLNVLGAFDFVTDASNSNEWNAPKPRHSQLLKSALQRQTDLMSNRLNYGCLWPTKAGNLVPIQAVLLICDAVALAKILNATLIIPHLEVNPVWQDSSTFMDIFDVDHFINVLKDDIRIAKELPDEYFWSTREYYATAIRANRVKTAPVHASANWYLENVSPVLQSYGIAAIAPFSHRLAFDNMPEDIQRLRCKVNFQALDFVPHIRALGDALVNRLRYPHSTSEADNASYLKNVGGGSKDKQGTGKFAVLHLRFDKDMAAHSACDFGGGKAEKLALAKYRQVIWQGRVLNSQFTDEELRSQGRCPLTPEEIGLLLAALGFNNSTRLYLASHKVYGGAARISMLRSIFPFMEDKKSLALQKKELKSKERLPC